MNQIEQELKKVSDHISISGKNDISLITIEQQLKLFLNGVKIPKIVKPCTIGDGIIELKKDDHDELLNLYPKDCRTIGPCCPS